MRNVHKNTIGIWGFGIVGKAAVNFFHKNNIPVTVYDNRVISPQEKKILDDYGVPLYAPEEQYRFLHEHNQILASPGVDLRPFKTLPITWLSELDIFYACYKNPIIAITGTIGKTSVTSLLSNVLNNLGIACTTAGNIGTGMLDLVDECTDYAILEVSSFQLEQCTQFRPTVALITNCYPNHLDRHNSLQEYFATKCAVFARQQSQDFTIMPLALAASGASWPPAHICFFSEQKPTREHYQNAPPNSSFIYGTHNYIVYETPTTVTNLIERALIPSISFFENWLMIIAVLTQLKMSLSIIPTITTLPSGLEHRLELVATINDIVFYNDSKSTTPASTLAALQKIQGKPTHLFVGGVSKGVDRAPFIQALANHVTHVYCFGKEAPVLHTWCTQAGVASSVFATLEEAFALCIDHAQPGDQVLFSPAGASFDLFNNYQERGEVFKELVSRVFLCI